MIEIFLSDAGLLPRYACIFVYTAIGLHSLSLRVWMPMLSLPLLLFAAVLSCHMYTLCLCCHESKVKMGGMSDEAIEKDVITAFKGRKFCTHN